MSRYTLLEGLAARYPVRVVFNLTGAVHALLYWSPSDSTKMVLARSERAVCDTWDRLIDDNPNLSPITYLPGEIVGPNNTIRYRYAIRSYRQEVDSFYYWFVDTVKEYWEHTLQCPPGVQFCRNHQAPTYYLPELTVQPDEDEYAESQRAERLADHYQCLNCLGGFVVPGHTRYSLFAKMYSAFTRRNGRPDSTRDPYGHTPPARPWSRTAPIFFVTEEFNSGLSLDEYRNPSRGFSFPGTPSLMIEGSPQPLPIRVQQACSVVQAAALANKSTAHLRGEQQREEKLQKKLTSTYEMFKELL